MIPVKIISEEQAKKLFKGCCCCGGSDNEISMGVLVNKKTGKVVEAHKVNSKTGEKTILFRDLSDPIFKKEKGGAE